MTFRVGQKVVCVDASPMRVAPERYPNMIVEKRVYTIRETFTAPGGNKLVYLVELLNPKDMWKEGFIEAPFTAHRFRPVVERKTDISVFTEILRTTKLPAPALQSSEASS